MSIDRRASAAAGAATLLVLTAAPVSAQPTQVNNNPTGTPIVQTVTGPNTGVLNNVTAPITQTVGTPSNTGNTGVINNSTRITQLIGTVASASLNTGMISNSIGVTSSGEELSDVVQFIGTSTTDLQNHGVPEAFLPGGFSSPTAHNSAIINGGSDKSPGCAAGLPCGQFIEGGSFNSLTSTGPDIVQGVAGFDPVGADSNTLAATGSFIGQIVTNAEPDFASSGLSGLLSPPSSSSASSNTLAANGTVINQAVFNGSGNHLGATGSLINEELTNTSNSAVTVSGSMDKVLIGTPTSAPLTNDTVTVASTGDTVTVDASQATAIITQPGLTVTIEPDDTGLVCVNAACND